MKEGFAEGASREVWPGVTGVIGWASTPSTGMTQTTRIVEPTRPGGPYIASIFDPQGRIVASHGFPLRAGAEKFLQAFMQERAGEHGLTLANETHDGRPA